MYSTPDCLVCIQTKRLKYKSYVVYIYLDSYLLGFSHEPPFIPSLVVEVIP